jgi:isoquinoline 1-oxidoreductase beta subunit
MKTLGPTQSSRRAFLKEAGAITATALTIGFEWVGPPRRAMAAIGSFGPAPFAPNAFLRIGADNSVTIIAKHLEMGQGSYTGIATVLAEELDADWTLVRVESAPADAKRYGNSVLGGLQGTGGSSAMANSWSQLRDAGGKARAMLVSAAAAQWHVPVEELTVDKGIVLHASSKRQATFGSLVAKASALPVPDKVTLKDPKDFKLIGYQIPHGAIHARLHAAWDADRVVEAATAVRRHRQEFRSRSRLRGARCRQGGAGAWRSRGGSEEFLGRQAGARCVEDRMG